MVVNVLCLFLEVLCVGFWSVIVAFSGHIPFKRTQHNAIDEARTVDLMIFGRAFFYISATSFRTEPKF